MQSDDTQTVLLIPADLGLVENYDLPIQLDRIIPKGSLHASGIFLRATLNEMVQITCLCKSLEENHRELLRDTKAQYDNLNRRRKELELLEGSKSVFKPFKYIAIRRAKRALRDEAQGLWVSTRTTSDMLKRDLVSIPLANLAPVESKAVRRDEQISGLAVPLPSPAEMNSPAVQEALAAAQEVASILASSGNPFANLPSSTGSLDGQSSTASSLFDSESLSSARSSVATPPSSPGSTSSVSWLNFNVNCNIINNVDSNAHGFTINNNGP